MILDTNALSAFADGDSQIGPVLRRQSRLVIPVIVLGEYRYGIAASRHRLRYEEWLGGLLVSVEVLTVTEATTAFYADLRTVLKRSGSPIPANDTWIASLALQHGLAVLTRDGHFDAVPGLTRVAW